MKAVLNFCILIAVAVIHVHGHGMMLDPPNRSSVWRYYEEYPINYDDNANFCGGFNTQWNLHEGKCGVCGDEYGLPHPQENEHTGLYGNGKIVAYYKSGQTIDVGILLTANHIGYFEYSLCEIKDEDSHESGEDCFKPLKLADGSPNYKVQKDQMEFINKIKLPDDFKCKHCVLRWHYHTGNSWGVCDDGKEGMGCGPQETFRTCSDIRIF